MPRSAGEKLGPYEIVARIGAGGMGEVFRARDSRMGREVAIKISAEQFSERFDKEVRAIASLNHPNVCTLHDVGPNYLVMELVEGSTLAEHIKQGPIPLEQALVIARQIAEALEAAHEKQIVHRDLKPVATKPVPLASAAPCTAPITGFVRCAPIVNNVSWALLTLSTSPAANTLRSIPAQKDSPLPASNIEPTLWSFSARSNTCTRITMSMTGSMSHGDGTGRWSHARRAHPLRPDPVAESLKIPVQMANHLRLRRHDYRLHLLIITVLF